jgi:nucleoside-diphosphate-sugar epimerase
MILITGAAGFIGHSLIRSLCDNYKLIGIDNFCNSELSTISPYLNKIIFYQDDVNNILDTKYEPFKSKITHIIHTSCSQISKSIIEPVNDLKHNGESTLKLLEFSKFLPNLQKFIYMSSVSIYGDSNSILESSPIDLHTPYSISKYIGEKYVEFYNKEYGIPYVILRLSNVYGYNQSPINGRICGVIGKFLYNIMNDIPIEVFGNGNASRDYTFIDDVTNITKIMLHNDITENNFNISTSTKTSTNDLINIISKYKTPTIIYSPKRDIDNVLDRKAINTKIKLYYPQFVNIEKGIKKILIDEYKYEL